MAATGFTPISLYYSATASAVPLAANLTGGELALNTNDGKLYYKNSGGTVALLASGSAASGSFTDLTVTGNTILGDANTDTVTVNGRVGIGSLSTSRVFQIANTSGTVTGTTQIGLFSGLTTDSTATSAYGVRSYVVADTAAVTTGYGYGILNPATANAGSFGAFVMYHAPNLTGTYATGGVKAFSANVTAGTDTWNFYAGGTAPNYFAGKVGIGTSSPAVTLAISATDAVLVPAGTTAERPTGATGYIRYNSTLNQFEGYGASTWGSIGGGATGANGEQVFWENEQSVDASYTITSGRNAGTFGPISIASGVTVTVPTGSVWSIV